MENRKSSIIVKRNLFRILAVAMLLISVACGILLAKANVRTLTVNMTIVEESVFEWWRFIMFTFIGLFGGSCLWAISGVYDELEKMRQKKNK